MDPKNDLLLILVDTKKINQKTIKERTKVFSSCLLLVDVLVNQMNQQNEHHSIRENDFVSFVNKNILDVI